MCGLNERGLTRLTMAVMLMMRMTSLFVRDADWVWGLVRRTEDGDPQGVRQRAGQDGVREFGRQGRVALPTGQTAERGRGRGGAAGIAEGSGDEVERRSGVL